MVCRRVQVSRTRLSERPTRVDDAWEPYARDVA